MNEEQCLCDFVGQRIRSLSMQNLRAKIPATQHGKMVSKCILTLSFQLQDSNDCNWQKISSLFGSKELCQSLEIDGSSIFIDA